MTTWLTSDWHLFHENIIKLSLRPFTSIEHMHYVLLENYRACVKDEDVVYFLGDLTLRSPKQLLGVRSIVSRMPGRKHYIVGNHDRFKIDSYLKMGFESVHSSLWRETGRRTVFMVHDPDDAPERAPLVICGHVHEKWRTRREPVPTVNVGVDQWGFRPAEMHAVLLLLLQLEGEVDGSDNTTGQEPQP